MNNNESVVQCLVSDTKYLPKRAHPTDAGADLLSVTEVNLLPGEQKMFDTGVAVKIPPNQVGLVFNRSSQGKKGVMLPNGVGVIDSDYRGNIKVMLKNSSTEQYTLPPDTAIAQLVILPVSLPEFVDTWNDTERGSGGFGSTNKTESNK